MSLSITTHTVVEGISGNAAVCSTSQYRPNTAVVWLQIDDDNITSVPDITLTQNVTTQTFTIVALFNLILNRDNNGQRVSCLIAHDTLHTPQISVGTIQVNCKYIVGFALDIPYCQTFPSVCLFVCISTLHSPNRRTDFDETWRTVAIWAQGVRV